MRENAGAGANGVAVEFDGVRKAFGAHEVLRGVNLAIPEGAVTVILGPSGTGKSVCLRLAVGLISPDAGDVRVLGASVPRMSDDELLATRRRLGVLFQDGALFGSMTLYDNVAWPLRQMTDRSEAEIEEVVLHRLREVGLERSRDRFPGELSGGMRKRAGFARALALDPEVVLFDEPDSGLDPVRTALLCEIIEEVHEQEGGTYVVISHDILSTRRLADHIAVLWHGRIVEAGPAEEVLASDNPFVQQFLTGTAGGPLTME